MATSRLSHVFDGSRARRQVLAALGKAGKKGFELELDSVGGGGPGVARLPLATGATPLLPRSLTVRETVSLPWKCSGGR